MLINARKSSYCTGGNCVEIGGNKRFIGIRDTKNPSLGYLPVSLATFSRILSSIKE